MQPLFSPPFTANTISCLGALCRVWHGIASGHKRGHKISISGSQLTVEGSEKRLSLRKEERELLDFLLENRGAVFTPETILSRLWWPDLPYDREFVDAAVASLNVLLRSAGLPRGMIESFHGVGYRLKPEDET
jgi:DNA-binding response OmpR family regulator